MSRYVKSLELLMKIKDKYKSNNISNQVMKEEIIMNIGADEKRTLLPYIKLMLDLKMISLEGQNVTILI